MDMGIRHPFTERDYPKSRNTPSLGATKGEGPEEKVDSDLSRELKGLEGFFRRKAASNNEKTDSLRSRSDLLSYRGDGSCIHAMNMSCVFEVSRRVNVWEKAWRDFQAKRSEDIIKHMVQRLSRIFAKGVKKR